jgi:uncharacterized protein YqjF (DUF2071 family)
VATFPVLEAVARQQSSIEQTAHRPWPLPTGPWAQAQTWDDLCFVHWCVDPDELRRHVPESVELAVHDGAAWLGIVPFTISSLRARGLPPLPPVASFHELNVRTVVTADGKPGIWFFTLDASSRLAVELAKKLYRLPYAYARIRSERIDGWTHYESARPGAAFSGRYRGVGEQFQAEPGSLEWFLTERYCLYTEDGGRLYRAEIHHRPWDLQRAEARIDLNTLSPVALPDDEPHVLYAQRQDTVIWPLVELEG